MGCRVDDPRATTQGQSEILGLAVDHCMGADANSPAAQHAFALWRAREAGYTLGPVTDALAAEADLVIDMHDAIAAARAAPRSDVG